MIVGFNHLPTDDGGIGDVCLPWFTTTMLNEGVCFPSDKHENKIQTQKKDDEEDEGEAKHSVCLPFC